MKINLNESANASITRAAKLLTGVTGGFDKAIKSIMPRVADYVRNESVNTIQERYAISAQNLRAEKNIKESHYIYSDGEMTASFNFSGHKIPLWRYDGGTKKVTLRYPSKKSMSDVIETMYASARQLRSESPKVLKNTFVARFRAGNRSSHTGIFEMTGMIGDHNNSLLEEKMGSSFPQMLGNEEVMNSLTSKAVKKFDERMEHEIMRILNGYGK